MLISSSSLYPWVLEGKDSLLGLERRGVKKKKFYMCLLGISLLYIINLYTNI